MRLIGQIFSFVLAGITVPLFVLASCNYAVEQTLLSPNTYQAVLDDEQIFEDIIPVALNVIVEESERPVSPPGAPPRPDVDDIPLQLRDITEALTPTDLRDMTSILIPPEWLQARSQQLFEVGTGLLTGDYDTLEDPVDFTVIRERWSGDEAVEAASLIIDAAPSCTRTQTDDLRRFFAQGNGKLPICSPTLPAIEEQIEAEIVAWLNSVAEELPAEEITVQELFELDRDTIRSIAIFVELDRQGLWLTLLCPLALLSLIVTLAIRSLPDFGRWMGGIGVAVGGFLVLLLIVIQILTSALVRELVTTESQVESFVAGIFSDLLIGAVREANSIFFIHAAIFVAIGFAMLTMNWLITRDDNDDVVWITADGQIMNGDGQVISTVTQKLD